MNVCDGFPLKPASFITRPYTIENEMEDSLGLNTFSTTGTQLVGIQIEDAIHKGAKRFLINLQDQNCAEYGMVFSRYTFLCKDFKIVIQFDQNYAQQFSPVALHQHLFDAIQQLGVGKIDCIKFPKPIAPHNRVSNSNVFEYLARMGIVHRAIIPN